MFGDECTRVTSDIGSTNWCVSYSIGPRCDNFDAIYVNTSYEKCDRVYLFKHDLSC